MAWEGWLRNVSAGGLRVVLSRRFEPGAALAVEAPGSDGDDSSSMLLARVVHVRPHRGAAWSLGCSFVSPLSDEEVQELTRSETLTDVVFRGTAPGGVMVERVIRKLNGVGRWPLRVGRKIGLRLHATAGAQPLVKVRVDACRSADGRRILECTFVEPRGAELAKALGGA